MTNGWGFLGGLWNELLKIYSNVTICVLLILPTIHFRIMCGIKIILHKLLQQILNFLILFRFNKNQALISNSVNVIYRISTKIVNLGKTGSLMIKNFRTKVLHTDPPASNSCYKIFFRSHCFDGVAVSIKAKSYSKKI